jgi:hypothetical protein
MTALARHEAKKTDVSTSVADANSFLEFIAQAARDPAVDVSKMERLFEMRERMLARDAHLQFNAALKQAKEQMPAVLKNKYNEQTKSHYANLESVSDAMDPIITANGFSLTFGTAPTTLEGHYLVTCTLAHEGGHEKAYEAPIPIDSAGIKGTANKTLTHAFGSTMSYGRRYLKMMIFDVKTTDDDGNSAGKPVEEVEFISDEQLAELRAAMKKTNTDEAKFAAYLKEPTLGALTVTKFEQAMAALRAKAQHQVQK